MILASYKIKCRNKFGIQISWLRGAAVCDRPQDMYLLCYSRNPWSYGYMVNITWHNCLLCNNPSERQGSAACGSLVTTARPAFRLRMKETAYLHTEGCSAANKGWYPVRGGFSTLWRLGTTFTLTYWLAGSRVINDDILLELHDQQLLTY
jgi:hypothetical protein